MTIFGADTRTQVADTTTGANSAIVRIQSTFADGAVAIGTGEIIDQTHVLTAGHVLYDAADGGYATQVLIEPGEQSGATPLGTYTAAKLEVDPRYAATAAFSLDFGVVTLSSKVTTVNSAQFFHLTALQTSQLAGLQVNTAGYPGDLNHQAAVQYQTSGTILAVGRNELYSQIDVFNGQSGSPVWVDQTDAATGAVQHVVVGIVDFATSAYNGFTRITQSLINEVDAVINADDSGTALTASQEVAAYNGTTSVASANSGGFGFPEFGGHFGFGFGFGFG